MKALLAGVLLLQAVLLTQSIDEAEFMAAWDANMRICGDELKLDIADFMHDSQAPNVAKLLQHEYQCLPKCILERFEVLRAGAYHHDKLMQIVPDMPADIEAGVLACVEEHAEPDLCARFAGVQLCVLQKVAKILPA